MEHLNCSMPAMSYWDKVLFIKQLEMDMLIYEEC